MNDLTKMSVEELVWLANDEKHRVMRDANRTLIRGIIAELTRRTEVPDGHVMLPGGKVVKAELQYWKADCDGDSCEELEDLLDGCGDGDECEVIPLLILPREVYRVAIQTDGRGVYTKMVGAELDDWKQRQKADDARRRTLPDNPSALAAKGVGQ